LHVDQAANRENALALASAHSYTDITLDLNLGSQSGLLLIHPLRQLQPNASVLVSKQAALLLPQAELKPEILVPLLQSWLSDKTPLAHMAQLARSCAIDDAAEQVAVVCRRLTGVN